MKLQIPDTYISNERIVSRLALESDLSNIISFFRSAVPSLVNNIKETSQTVASLKFISGVQKSKAQEVRKDFIKIKNIYDGTEYSRYEKLLVSCPEDFSGYYLDYTKMLENVSKTFVPAAIDMLAKYQAYLARFITDKESRKKIQDHKDITKEAEIARNDVLSNIKVFFPTNTGKTKTYFKNVVQRMVDLTELSEMMVALEKREKEIEIDKILQMVNKCVELLDIIKDYASDQDFSDVSSQSIKCIAHGAKTMGEIVECLAVLKTKQSQIVFKIEDLLVYITKNH